MAIRISGPGVGLPPPQNLYPTELNNAPYDVPTNLLSLSPGDTLTIPAGEWLVDVGTISVLQYLDPVTGIWRAHNAQRGQSSYIRSDGFTTRVANLTGCPVAAVVTGGGSNYTQVSATVTVSGSGGSTWQPIVGGQLSVTSVTNAGANYGIAPLVFIAAPPNPGVPATAYATISAGTVSGVTLSNVGAGYLTAPAAVILPQATDPNFATISQATATFALNSAGKITAVLCTNNGAPVATYPTLTVGGSAGSGATVSAVWLEVATGITVPGAGAGVGIPGALAEVSSVGGQPAAGTFTNPGIELASYRPRKASIGVTVTGGTVTTLATIYDSGMFAIGGASGAAGTNPTVPTALVTSGAGLGVATTSFASVLLTLGSATGSVLLQPL